MGAYMPKISVWHVHWNRPKKQEVKRRILRFIGNFSKLINGIGINIQIKVLFRGTLGLSGTPPSRWQPGRSSRQQWMSLEISQCSKPEKLTIMELWIQCGGKLVGFRARKM
ncbi:hypothetical protein C5167_006165 [Papaver somniferum]|uniref:Uncharacterized protein n=1 Tax=Papaver somniferum TaxID=3469 RepID=A0A4Y7JCP6_PAPSO|nr:hypothetical protein C5167_006165 [Papaver somniferum]